MRRLLVILVGGTVLLLGCGGNGDGGSTATPEASLVTITSANAPTIASAVMSSALDTEGLSALGGLGAIGIPVNGKTATVAMSKLGDITNIQTEWLKQQAQLGVLQAPIPEQTIPCAVGDGTMTLSGDIANAATLTAGDNYSFAFVDCDQGDGVVIDGIFALAITSFSGDLLSGMILLGIEVTVTGFEVDDGTDIATMNGRVQMEMDLRDPTVTSVSISTTSMTVADGTSSQTLIDFSIVQTFDSSANTLYTLDISGSLSSSAFNGRIDFSTTALLQNDGGEYAFSGEVVITGTNDTSVTVFVLGTVSVELRIDLDGNGSVDETVITTWDELS